jgi:hypothetical protein
MANTYMTLDALYAKVNPLVEESEKDLGQLLDKIADGGSVTNAQLLLYQQASTDNALTVGIASGLTKDRKDTMMNTLRNTTS